MIILDGNYMKSREKAHAYLKKKLDLPDYYGENLDALWDILTSSSEKIDIKFINEDRAIGYLKDYGRSLSDLFKDLSQEKRNIKLKIKNY